MSTPLLTVLNFSGGKQSSALLWMVILGHITRPDNFVVLNADPGMENSLTYKYIDKMKDLCVESEIYFETVNGPNLYKDIQNIVPISVNGQVLHIDNPPYWSKSKNGKVGKLMQKCTRHYKVRPMDRAIRRLLQERHGYSIYSKRIPEKCVEKWIGFSYDEMNRINNPEQKYIKFRFPLIEKKLTKADIEKYFLDNNIPLPPRSVCNACFANGLNTLKEMYYNRPKDWAQAVEVDKKIRNLKAYGIDKEIYVSKTLVPLEDLPNFDFDIHKIMKHLSSEKSEPDNESIFFAEDPSNTDKDGWSCDSGYCFT